jgi:hypothetical protein
MTVLMNFILLILLTGPLVFQLIYGSKATNPSGSYKFWKISLITLILFVLTSLLNLFIMTERIKLAQSRDGLPFITLLILEACIGSIMVLVVLVQLFIKFRRKVTPR